MKLHPIAINNEGVEFQVERRNQREYSPEENSVGFVFCLSIDLIGSTEAGLKLTTQRLDSFNISLVNQIRPHLEKLGLTDALIKFTGDGWLVMTEKVKDVPALCCLATIMANRFQDEISQETGIVKDSVPSLRLAICSGRDIRVELPDGRKDWVGDSARRATRVSGCCLPNEILIDVPVCYCVSRDFDIKPMDVKQRLPEYQPKKMEEDLTLYVLGELKTEAAAGSEAPEYFVHTLGKIGKVKEATTVAQQVSERLGDEVSKLGIAEKEALQRILRSWNRLMASVLDYSSTLELLKSIRAAGLAPNVVTYNTLIDKAPDYDAAKAWVDTMRAEGIQPDVVTYNTLINKAPDYDAAKVWVDTMCAEGIQPNVVTYNTLINKAPDYDAAKAWVDTMRAEGIQPNVVTYSTLFSKDLSGKSADDILEWYLAQKYHSEEPIQAAIATYRKIRRIDQALRLALDYPHLQAARKLLREHDEEALAYFRGISDNDPQHPNADYALGVALMELGRQVQAQPHLKRAFKLATAPPRKALIKEWLRQIDANCLGSDQ
jgi:tetratricopeptide (TPR) repeat protein